MSKYIDADKLTAEIEGLKERYGSIIPQSITAQNYQEGRLIGYEDALYKIKKSLPQEQPEEELEKEIKRYQEHYILVKEKGFSLDWMDIETTARHFYELGLNTRKEE